MASTSMLNKYWYWRFDTSVLLDGEDGVSPAYHGYHEDIHHSKRNGRQRGSSQRSAAQDFVGSAGLADQTRADPTTGIYPVLDKHEAPANRP